MLGLDRAIVYNNFKGGVQVCHPAPEIFRIMSLGGYWSRAPRGFVETQIGRQIAAGISPDHARKFAEAVAFGGLTEAESWEVIRDRDCARHGNQHEIFRLTDLPDRWFRGAWSRSHNGGPIGIDLEAARLVHWSRIRAAVNDENKRRREAFEPLRPIAPRWNTVRNAIKHARDEDELRRVWLPELSKH